MIFEDPVVAFVGFSLDKIEVQLLGTVKPNNWDIRSSQTNSTQKGQWVQGFFSQKNACPGKILKHLVSSERLKGFQRECKQVF